MTASTQLSTADLHERLEAAVLAEEGFRLALERLQAASAMAGEEPNADERQAEAALAQAASTIQRIEAAISASTIRDNHERNAAAKAAAEKRDLLTLQTLAGVERAAAKVEAAIAGYVTAYRELLTAAGTARGMIAETGIRIDTALPRADLLVEEEIARIAAGELTPPGAAHLIGRDPTALTPLTAQYASFVNFFRTQLGRELAA